MTQSDERERPISWDIAVKRYRLLSITRRRQAGEDLRAEYSRKQVRELVEHYVRLLDGMPGDGILPAARSADWALARIIEAKADIDAAMAALETWEWANDPRLPRTRCLTLGLMAGRGFGATGNIVGVANRNGEVRRYMEEGLEFLYDYLRGRRVWSASIGLPRLDPYGLQSYRDERGGAASAESRRRADDLSRPGNRGRRWRTAADEDRPDERSGGDSAT